MATLTEKMKNLDLNPKGLAESISKTLSLAILEGVLKGGDQLVEANLQERFGISRSPIREAFRDLEKMGLVTIVPRKGAFVKKITRKDIEENFPVRASLEGLAAKIAFKNMPKERLEALAEAFQNLKESVDAGDSKAFMKHHLTFHEIFIKASGNDTLIGILENLRIHNLWYRFSYQYYTEDLKKSLDTHRRILRLFQNKQTDPKAIEEMVKGHIEAAVERFSSYLKEQGE